MSRARKVLLAIGAVVVLMGGAAFVVPSLLFNDGVDYSQAISIKTAPEFQDAALLEKAWALPVAQLYKPGLDFQTNPSFCGPASVVNVLRSLGTQADQATVLEGTQTKTTAGLVMGGLTLDQLAEISRKKLGKKVTVLHDLDLTGFRAQLGRANDPAVRLILNFHRGPIFGKGGGHHSPIAGYLAAEDLVFVLDVNAGFKPWLVKSARLFEAMNTVDKGAGKKRGLLVIETY
jgi:hypothetical protein